MKAKWGTSTLALLVLLAGSAAAYSRQTPSSGESELDVVTVEAQKQRRLIEDQISQFVSSITLPGREQSLGRWQRPICFLVGGLPRDQGEFIVARLSQIAKSSAAPLAPAQCKPNFLIVVTLQ